jgi:hypothetical protein
MSKSPTLFFSAIVPLIAGMCVATSSNAQSTMSDDAAYCQALSKKFFTNEGGTVAPGGGSAVPLEATVAISQCKDNPGSAIPVLEKVLRENGVALPRRT